MQEVCPVAEGTARGLQLVWAANDTTSENVLLASGRSWDAESWLFQSDLIRALSLFAGIEEQ